MSPQLSPAQDDARHRLVRAARAGNVGVLIGPTGIGKTTILRDVHAEIGGQFLTARELMAALRGHHPLAVEEALYELVSSALAASDAVVMDDLHLLTNVVCCGHSYPRMGLVSAPLTALVAEASARGKLLVLAMEEINFVPPWGQRQMVPIADFGTADYAHICRAYLSATDADRLDVQKIHRYARKLTAGQLRSTCLSLRESGEIDTERFVDHLRAHHLAANVDLHEVQAVELHDLKGLDDVLEALEANVILPLENTELADELGLTAKRGVLLAGPPGTGKTTVGRALAHRLKSKFFLIDGTVISGTSSFFPYIRHVFDSAKRNAPAIIFIDDSDVLFEGNAEAGFYRYLLTILDGIESESVGHICLMMTAMDVGNLPPALVRSGRIELWLETRLPTEPARLAILADQCAGLPASMGEVDLNLLASATDGLSGADLRRLVDDGKLLFAYDRARGRDLLPAADYFLRAIETVRANKQRYAEAEARARANRPNRPPFFDFMEMVPEMVMGMGGMASADARAYGMEHG
jgi:ATP-dependent 26S proteasome regulatory subunit